MKRKHRIIIIITILVLLFITAFTMTLFLQQVKMNDGHVTGNTAGNLNNNGLFCESGGVIYFSNPYDGGCLYSMNPDETNMKKLTTAKATSINADEHYLYYYLDSSKKGKGLGFVQRTYGVYRSKLNGKSPECLKRGNAITLQLSGNYLYYQYFDNNNKNGTELHKVKIDKSEEKRVADYNINPASCVNGIIYYNGTQDDHYLYSLNTQNDSVSVVWDGDVWNPVYDNGYFYFMNVSDNYSLCRYLPNENVVEKLTNDRIDFFNVCGGYIYYQKSSAKEPALKRMYPDGSSPEIVAEGIYKNLNATSQYLYFSGFASDAPMYRTPVNGAVNVTTFDAAANAVVN